MRNDDSRWNQLRYKRSRTVQSVYGFMVSLIGFGFMAFLPGPEWLRHLTGWAIVLLGGMMVNATVVKEWFSTFGGFLPWFRRSGERRDPEED